MLRQVFGTWGWPSTSLNVSLFARWFVNARPGFVSEGQQNEKWILSSSSSYLLLLLLLSRLQMNYRKLFFLLRWHRDISAHKLYRLTQCFQSGRFIIPVINIQMTSIGGGEASWENDVTLGQTNTIGVPSNQEVNKAE
jgi:hypothetical protein